MQALAEPTSNDYAGIKDMSIFPVASVESLAEWARGIKASREPDTVIGADYLRRWWIIPRNDYSNVYLHQLNHDDDDRALHDHPADNTSLILEGSYREITPEGSFIRKAGDMVRRSATDPHRLEWIEPVTSLFFMGPKYRNWGFHCPQGFVPWNQFVDPDNPALSGPGCGE